MKLEKYCDINIVHLLHVLGIFWIKVRNLCEAVFLDEGFSIFHTPQVGLIDWLLAVLVLIEFCYKLIFHAHFVLIIYCLIPLPRIIVTVYS